MSLKPICYFFFFYLFFRESNQTHTHTKKWGRKGVKKPVKLLSLMLACVNPAKSWEERRRGMIDEKCNLMLFGYKFFDIHVDFLGLFLLS